MYKELICFLNFNFQQELTTIKTIEKDVVVESKRWILNWNDYKKQLEELNINDNSLKRPYFERYKESKSDKTFFDDFIMFQTALKQQIAEIINKNKISKKFIETLLKETNNLPLQICLNNANKISEEIKNEDLKNINFEKIYITETYRIFLLALVRELIYEKIIFNFELKDNKFYFLEEKLKEKTPTINSKVKKQIEDIKEEKNFEKENLEKPKVEKKIETEEQKFGNKEKLKKRLQIFKVKKKIFKGKTNIDLENVVLKEDSLNSTKTIINKEAKIKPELKLPLLEPLELKKENLEVKKEDLGIKEETLEAKKENLGIKEEILEIKEEIKPQQEMKNILDNLKKLNNPPKEKKTIKLIPPQSATEFFLATAEYQKIKK